MFDVDPENGLTLVEIAEGVELVDIVQSTGCEFVKSNNLKTMGQIEWMNIVVTNTNIPYVNKINFAFNVYVYLYCKIELPKEHN